MTMITRNKIKGFTLVEILLVLVIISSVIYMLLSYMQQKTLQMRIDRTTLQMQQILNAGLAYYVGFGTWPLPAAGTAVDITATPGNLLQSSGYLPSNVTIVSPWGGAHYSIYTDPANKLFYVYTSITSPTSGAASAAGNVIAGTLPMAYTTKTNATPPQAGTACVAADTTCYVVSSITIPGQNLNSNAGNVNFAGLYRHGGCVPVPTCPTDPATGVTPTPEVFIVPVSVTGLNDPNSGAIYPISSFTAYAMDASASPNPCKFSSIQPDCTTNTVGSAPPSGLYWRACLSVVTEKGNVQATNQNSTSPGSGNTGFGTDYGANVTLMAITRCPKPGEPSGSNFTVYSN